MGASGKNKREKSVDILDRLFWTVQPPKGLLKGDYYREEERFSQEYEGDIGHLGTLEVVQAGGKILWVEFNEIANPTYYMRMQQNMSKRLSNYGFFQASKERTATTGVVLVNGITHLEEQMVKENRLTGDFDLLAGASNSLNRSMLPLAKKIAARLEKPSGQLYYGLSKEVQPGVTGRLQVVVEAGKIVRCFYDEIFADTQEAIEDPELKQYYRQSKYYAPEYVSTIGIGFNSFSDLIEKKAVENQSLTTLPGMPFTQDPPAIEWEHYLALAKELEAELEKTGALKG